MNVHLFKSSNPDEKQRLGASYKQLAFFIFVYSTTFPQHPDRIHPGKPHFSYVELTLFSVFSLSLRHKTIMFMKKVKITILKTMLNEDLAREYGIPGLKACPMMKVGDVFYAAMKHGRPSTSTCLPLRMAQTKHCSTMVTGLRNPALPSSVATTASDRLL